jgi:hypothetical protein
MQHFGWLPSGLIGAVLLSGCSNLALLPPAVPNGTQLSSYAQSDFGPRVAARIPDHWCGVRG